MELHLEIHNFGPAAAAQVRCTGAVANPVTLEVSLPESDRAAATLRVERTASGGAIEVRLSVPGDGLALDDVVTFVAPPLPAPSIAVLAEPQGSVFVRAAARALAEEAMGTVIEPATGTRADFLLVEGGAVALATGSASFAAFGVLAPGAAAEAWALPSGIDWDRSAPLLKGLDFSDLYVQTALRRSLPPGQTLLQARTATGEVAPLMVLATANGIASLHTAFRLQDSNLALLPAFPQLLRRTWLAGLSAAEPIPLPQPPDLLEADLRHLPAAVDGALPEFGQPQADLGPWCLWFAALCLALRLLLR
jgi:hypothetical protein